MYIWIICTLFEMTIRSYIYKALLFGWNTYDMYLSLQGFVYFIGSRIQTPAVFVFEFLLEFHQTRRADIFELSKRVDRFDGMNLRQLGWIFKSELI